MDYERRFGDAMSYSQITRDHVDSIARAINVSNAGTQSRGATVNLIFTWVRLAQRIPVTTLFSPAIGEASFSR
jgi:multidrug resistance efflux pump